MFSLSRQPEKTHESGGVPWRALAGSLALHALALGMFAGVPLAELAGVAPAAPLRAELRPAPEAVAVAAVAPSPAVSAAPRRAAMSVPAADAVPPAPTSGATAGQEPAVHAAAGGVPSTPVETKAVTVALAEPRETRGPDAAGLRQYRLALAGEARRFRSYPETARRAGMAGTAEVRVSIAVGAPRQTELARSSGHAILDTAALEMLRAAAASTSLPESLRGQEFAVLLPVVFEVDD